MDKLRFPALAAMNDRVSPQPKHSRLTNRRQTHHTSSLSGVLVYTNDAPQMLTNAIQMNRSPDA